MNIEELRNEEIEKATDAEFDGKWFEDEGDYIMQTSKFKKGIKWADEHPRKGLVDIDEVCNLLSKKIVDITYLNDEDRNEFVENIRHTLLKNETEKNKEQ